MKMRSEELPSDYAKDEAGRPASLPSRRPGLITHAEFCIRTSVPADQDPRREKKGCVTYSVVTHYYAVTELKVMLLYTCDQVNKVGKYIKEMEMGGTWQGRAEMHLHLLIKPA